MAAAERAIAIGRALTATASKRRVHVVCKGFVAPVASRGYVIPHTKQFSAAFAGVLVAESSPRSTFAIRDRYRESASHQANLLTISHGAVDVTYGQLEALKQNLWLGKTPPMYFLDK